MLTLIFLGMNNLLPRLNLNNNKFLRLILHRKPYQILKSQLNLQQFQSRIQLQEIQQSLQLKVKHQSKARVVLRAARFIK
jgi:uncharacterized protein (DUF1919 family)